MTLVSKFMLTSLLLTFLFIRIRVNPYITSLYIQKKSKKDWNYQNLSLVMRQRGLTQKKRIINPLVALVLKGEKSRFTFNEQIVDF